MGLVITTTIQDSSFDLHNMAITFILCENVPVTVSVSITRL